MKSDTTIGFSGGCINWRIASKSAVISSSCSVILCSSWTSLSASFLCLREIREVYKRAYDFDAACTATGLFKTLASITRRVRENVAVAASAIAMT